MDNNAYIEMMCKRYARYFNVYRDYELLNKKLDVFAEYNVKNERYVLSKKAVIYSFNNFEYCLIEGYDTRIEGHHVDEFCSYIIKAAGEIVKPSSEHMSSYFTGVMVCDKGFSEEAVKIAERFKYSKDFMFTLKGWCDARLVLADPLKDLIVTNKKGREVRKNYLIGTEAENCI